MGVVVVSTALLAVCSFVLIGDDLGEAVGRFTVLGGLMGLVVLVSLREKRAGARAYQECWRRICHVLEGEHSHEGFELTGTWKGRSFRAFANIYYGGEYIGIVRQYRVSMPAERPGRAGRRSGRGARGAPSAGRCEREIRRSMSG